MSAVLVTGGTGKTGRRVAERLRARGLEARVGSRSGSPAPEPGAPVRFDWAERETWAAALEGVGAAYLVAPAGRTDVLDATRPFLEVALAAGVRRFVLLSAAALPEGGPMMGEVHAWLRARAPEWAVLRPSWFMQNFSEQQHLATIRDEGAVYSAAGDGRVAFVDAGDIAEAACALLARVPPQRDYVLTGPRALSYDEAAAAIAEAAGRPVRHVRLSVSELSARLQAAGMTRRYADLLAGMDGEVARGAEDRTTGDSAALTGKAPTSFERFAADNAGCWAR